MPQAPPIPLPLQLVVDVQSCQEPTKVAVSIVEVKSYIKIVESLQKCLCTVHSRDAILHNNFQEPSYKNDNVHSRGAILPKNCQDLTKPT